MSQLGSFSPCLAVKLGLALAIVFGGCGGKSSSTNKYPDASTAGTGGTIVGGGTGGVGGAGTGGVKAGSGGSGTGTGGRVGAGGATAGGGIGKSCASAADCGAGLTCILPSDKLMFGSGGPANGYCTVACTMTTSCPGGSTCVETALSNTDPSQAFCFQLCTSGPLTTAAPVKCQGRDMDVACTPLTDGTDGGASVEVCLPTCSQDSDCPAGRKCDEFTAVCVDAQRAGSPQGAHCDPTATTMQCAGECLPIGSGTTLIASFCSRRCVVGNLQACNWVPKTSALSSGGTHGVCLYADAPNADVGDVGYCGQECDLATDCSDKTDPGVSCDITTLSDPSFNSHGFCTWAGPTDAGAKD